MKKAKCLEIYGIPRHRAEGKTWIRATGEYSRVDVVCKRVETFGARPAFRNDAQSGLAPSPPSSVDVAIIVSNLSIQGFLPSGDSKLVVLQNFIATTNYICWA